MMKKKFYSWNDIETMCMTIANKMHKDNWIPDYIVGITRGGNVPATILSNMLSVRCEALKVSLRDAGDGPSMESNCWMAEDAFGYNYEPVTGITGARWDPSLRKKILIVDDINDSGDTFQWIKNDWESSCLPQEDIAWKAVWHHNVKFAALTYNISSKFDIDYWADECNKLEEDLWQVYPWEVVGNYEICT
jgi:hypoxanthine phosphoribosyltransferase